MSILFKPLKIGKMEVKNRFVRSATTSYWSDKRGVLRSDIISLYGKLAEGGVGLIIKGHLYVKKSGKAHKGMAGISNDFHLKKLKALTDKVHEFDGKIVAQLNHAGIYSIVDSAGPSELMVHGQKTRVLSSDEIYNIIEAFGDAANRAMIAGFDGVQIHGAHGYLVSQFLSQLANKRTDEWGGNLDNRMRILLKIYASIKANVGANTPIMLKINCDDFSPKGFTIDDSIKVAEVICKKGINAIEVSGGGVGRQKELLSRAKSPDQNLKEATFAGHAKKLRKATRSTPMALVNGIKSTKCMETILNRDLVDLVSMSRPFIKEPDLVKRIQSGQKASTCTSCDICISKDVFGKQMLRCHLI
ncbi:MAG: NADH:flavin oxidoreductase [Candidatus Bathyarchaeota archaeon]